MKYLFTIQGEGRGHMTQALVLSEMLRKNGHEIGKVIIGMSHQREVPEYFIRKIGSEVEVIESPSFIFKKDKKKVNWLKTVLYNANPLKTMEYIRSIKKIRKSIQEFQPDVVINFYEMLTGFTHLIYGKNNQLVTIGHQYLFNYLSDKYKENKLKSNFIFLRFHAWMTGLQADKILALSFYPVDDKMGNKKIKVVPPLLRKEVRNGRSTKGTFILGYLLNEGFEKEIRSWHEKNPEVNLKIFWDKKNVPEEVKIDQTLTFYTLNDQKFIQYMTECVGYISTAGFESICESFYLKKPVMVIPVHIEQKINAHDAVSTGKCISANTFDISKLLNFINTYSTHDTSYHNWVSKAEEIYMEQIVTKINHKKESELDLLVKFN
ncbi:glycosyltransferase family protein [Apibacter raozihei]|uniref:glycosyltransferase family protein n=1 Tax=Apibacter raozihei TaxID=2500547 RepID=UPI000FE2EE0D|nr:glycosyltransferase family protein [Apibacter raozihei]